MKGVRIHYGQNVSPEVRGALEPHLERWAFLIPAWCQEVRVTWNDRDGDRGAISIAVYYEYRNADLEVLPNFLTNPETRAQDVVHELLHLSLAPFTVVAEAMRDALIVKAPDVEEWANQMLRHGEEASTCDLVAMVMERLP